MSEKQAVESLVRGLGTILLISLLYAGCAVWVRERFGAAALLRLAPAAALLIFSLGSYGLWTNFHAAGVASALSPALFGTLALGVCIPLAGSTWLIARQRIGVDGARLIRQSLGGVLAFWLSLFLALVPVLALDLMRFFGG